MVQLIWNTIYYRIYHGDERRVIWYYDKRYALWIGKVDDHLRYGPNNAGFYHQAGGIVIVHGVKQRDKPFQVSLQGIAGGDQ